MPLFSPRCAPTYWQEHPEFARACVEAGLYDYQAEGALLASLGANYAEIADTLTRRHERRRPFDTESVRGLLRAVAPRLRRVCCNEIAHALDIRRDVLRAMAHGRPDDVRPEGVRGVTPATLDRTCAAVAFGLVSTDSLPDAKRKPRRFLMRLRVILTDAAAARA